MCMCLAESNGNAPVSTAHRSESITVIHGTTEVDQDLEHACYR